jgi:hypothetical protein
VFAPFLPAHRQTARGGHRIPPSCEMDGVPND